jgi:hypothetical protein
LSVYLLPGLANYPLHWSLRADRRAVCIRSADGQTEGGDLLWSQPVDVVMQVCAGALPLVWKSVYLWGQMADTACMPPMVGFLSVCLTA